MNKANLRCAMVIVVVPYKDWVVGPLPYMAMKMAYKMGGDPNHLQVLGWPSKY